MFKLMRSKNLQPRLLYPAKLSLRMEGQIKSFPDNKKLKEVFTTTPVPQVMLKGLGGGGGEGKREGDERRRRRRKL